jgi:hypothetical protein
MKRMKLSAFVLTLLLAASLPAAAGSGTASRDANIRMEMNEWSRAVKWRWARNSTIP